MSSNIDSVIKDKIRKNNFRPTDPNFFQHVTVNTHIFFFGLTLKGLSNVPDYLYHDFYFKMCPLHTLFLVEAFVHFILIFCDALNDGIVGLSFYTFHLLKNLLLENFPDFFGKPCPINTGGIVLIAPAKMVCGGIAGMMAQTFSWVNALFQCLYIIIHH